MATEDRQTDPDLIKELIKEPFRFSFFQSIYLLERYAASVQHTEAIGGSGPAGMESLRLRPEASLAFPISDLVSIEKTNDPIYNRLLFIITTSFFGLYGSDSPLPDFYTEDILKSDPEESSVKDFLDIFHHRLLSLLYRCWIKYRYYLQFEPDGKDSFSRYIFSLMGMGIEDTPVLSHIKPVRLLKYVGLLSQRTRPAPSLERILSDYFDGIRVDVEQCISCWKDINNESLLRLGSEQLKLGLNTVIGNKILDRSSKFRISIYVRDMAEFCEFLPSGGKFKELLELVELFLNEPLDFEERLVIAGCKVPLSNLSSVQLGWTSFISSNPIEGDVSVVFQIDNYRRMSAYDNG